MHRTPSRRRLTRRAKRRTLPARPRRCACRPAVENRSAPLDPPRIGGCGGDGRSAVDRARPRLRHNHTAGCRRRCGRSGSRRFRRTLSRWSFCRHRRGSGCRNDFSRRRLLGSRKRGRHNRFGRGSGRGRSNGPAIRCGRSWRRSASRDRRAGHNGASRWFGGNSAGLRSGSYYRRCWALRGRRSDHHRRRLPRLRNDPAWCWCRWCRGRRRCRNRRSGRGRLGCRHRGRRWPLCRRRGYRNLWRYGRGWSWPAGWRVRRRHRRRSRWPCRHTVQLLLAPLQNRLRHIPDMMHLRPIDLWLYLGFMPRTAGQASPSQDVGAHKLGFVLLNRARVRLFLGHANFGQSIQNSFALDFQFPR
jgi:hypothetical protein